MIATQRKGLQYSENLVNYILSFNEASVWTPIPASGASKIEDTDYFEGTGSLSLSNFDVVNDITFSNTNHGTVIPIDGKFGFGFYLYKEEPLVAITGSIEVYKNAILFNTEDFSFGSSDSELDVNGNWQSFDSSVDYNFVKDDVITFKFKIDGIPGSVLGSITLFVDGFMIYNKKRLQSTAPIFSPKSLTANFYTGWGNYSDTLYTVGAPFTVIDAAPAVLLPNNKGTTLEIQKPIDVDTFYDGTVITGRNGDGINVTIEFKCKPLGVDPSPRITVYIDIGGGIPELYTRDFVLSKGTGVEHYYLSSFNAYTLDTWEANGGTLYVAASGEDIEIYDIRYIITRTHKAR